MIDDETTTDTLLPGVPVTRALREELARCLHWLEHDNHGDDPTCWAAWEPEADALMPTIVTWLARVWDEGARHGSRGVLPDAERERRNPYRGDAWPAGHANDCPCRRCYIAAMGGGR